MWEKEKLRKAKDLRIIEGNRRNNKIVIFNWECLLIVGQVTVKATISALYIIYEK